MRVVHGPLASLALFVSACSLEHPMTTSTVGAPTVDATIARDVVAPPESAVETGLDAAQLDASDVTVMPDTVTTPDTSDAGEMPDARDAPPPRDAPELDVTDAPQPDVTAPHDTGAPPSGASCEDAIPIRVMTGEQMLAGDTARAGAGLYAGGCNPMTTNAPEAVYRLVLDRAMQVDLLARSQPGASSFDPALYLFRDACTGAGEVACSADENDDQGPEARLRRVLTPGTYFVVVDGDATPARMHAQSGRFALRVELRELDGYTVTVQTGTTCPAVPAGAMEPPFVSQNDDGVSPPLSTGSFRFTLFGDVYEAFTVSTNGYVELQPTGLAVGTMGNASASHRPVPDRDDPDQFVAPYWSDLLARNSASRVYYWFDGPTNARVAHVRWRDYSHYTRGGPIQDINLEFEARLFFHTSSSTDRQNDAIEFQYCTVSANAANLRRATGLVSTTGFENTDGSRGVQFAYDTANAVRTGDLLRFERR